MDRAEALEVLAGAIATWRQLGYADALKHVDKDPVVLQMFGESGVEYFIEIQFLWENPREKRNIFGIASIDDGEAPDVYQPLCENFEIHAEEDLGT